MQFILFTLDNKKFASDILVFKEVIRLASLTPVPNAPFYFMGLANLRGSVLPVVDLFRKLYGPLKKETKKRERIIVIEADDDLIGFEIDQVLGIEHIENDQITNYHDSLNEFDQSEMKGIFKKEGETVIILNMYQILEHILNENK